MSKIRTLFVTVTFFIAAYSGAAEELGAPILVEELSNRISAGTAPLILDVRSPEEYEQGHVPGAINIPHSELENRIRELGMDESQELVVYCRSGRRAAIAENILLDNGYSSVRDLSGHWQEWVKLKSATD